MIKSQTIRIKTLNTFGQQIKVKVQQKAVIKRWYQSVVSCYGQGEQKASVSQGSEPGPGVMEEVSLYRVEASCEGLWGEQLSEVGGSSSVKALMGEKGPGASAAVGGWV